MPEHRPGLARAQHVAVIDAVRPERHRRHQRHHLAPRVRRPGPIAEINHPVDQTPRSRAGRRAPPGAAPRRSRPPARHRRRTLVASGRPFTMWVTSCRRPAVAATRQLSACSGGHLNLSPDDSPPNNGGSRLRRARRAAGARGATHRSRPADWAHTGSPAAADPRRSGSARLGC